MDVQTATARAGRHQDRRLVMHNLADAHRAGIQVRPNILIRSAKNGSAGAAVVGRSECYLRSFLGSHPLESSVAEFRFSACYPVWAIPGSGRSPTAGLTAMTAGPGHQRRSFRLAVALEAEAIFAEELVAEPFLAVSSRLSLQDDAQSAASPC